MIPEFCRVYFWDADWEDLNRNQEKYSKFIITRLADKGDIQQVRWLVSQYGLKKVAETAANSSKVTDKTRNFWSHVAEMA